MGPINGAGGRRRESHFLPSRLGRLAPVVRGLWGPHRINRLDDGQRRRRFGRQPRDGERLVYLPAVSQQTEVLREELERLELRLQPDLDNSLKGGIAHTHVPGGHVKGHQGCARRRRPFGRMLQTPAVVIHIARVEERDTT